MRPTHYTMWEGGPWREWPLEEVTEGELTQRDSSYVTIFGVRVHSLAFNDPAKGWGNFPRWDCINGWTDE